MATSWFYVQNSLPNPDYQAAYEKWCLAQTVYWREVSNDAQGVPNGIELFAAKCALDDAEMVMNSIPKYILK